MLNLSASDRKSLSTNRFVRGITPHQVQFVPEFKIKAIKLHKLGLSPSEVFLKLGIDPVIFLPFYPKKCLNRWKKIFELHGAAGFKTEKRGKLSTGRPKKKMDCTKSLIERIAYLEAENDFLKKLRALEEEHVTKKSSR